MMLNSSNQAVGFAYVNSDGTFSIPNLSLGLNRIRIENPKVSCSPIQVVISEANPNTNISLAATANGLNVVTANAEILESAKVSIVPNPAGKQISLQGLSGKISIINAQGKTVLEANDAQNVDIQSLSPGLYLVQGSTMANTTVTARFVKN